jgi:hypothetical protein
MAEHEANYGILFLEITTVVLRGNSQLPNVASVTLALSGVHHDTACVDTSHYQWRSAE